MTLVRQVTCKLKKKKRVSMTSAGFGSHLERCTDSSGSRSYIQQVPWTRCRVLDLVPPGCYTRVTRCSTEEGGSDTERENRAFTTCGLIRLFLCLSLYPPPIFLNPTLLLPLPLPGWILQGSRLAESVPVASQTAAHYLKHVWLPGARLDEG